MERPQISAFHLSIRKALWIPVLMVIIAIGLFVGARQMAVEARLLANEGVDTTARVTYKERRRHTDTDGNVSYSYHLRYIFDTTAGESILGAQSVSRRLHDSVRIGSRIPVRYVPSRPRLNRVEPERTLLTRLAMNLGSSVLLLGGGFLFWYMHARMRAMLRAVRKGRCGRARVIGWSEVEGWPVKEGRKPWQVMEWRDDANNRHGKTWPKKPALAKDFPAGSEITVWYDPRSDRGFWEWEIRFWPARVAKARAVQDEGGSNAGGRVDPPKGAKTPDHHEPPASDRPG